MTKAAAARPRPPTVASTMTTARAGTTTMTRPPGGTSGKTARRATRRTGPEIDRQGRLDFRPPLVARVTKQEGLDDEDGDDAHGRGRGPRGQRLRDGAAGAREAGEDAAPLRRPDGGDLFRGRPGRADAGGP